MDGDLLLMLELILRGPRHGGEETVFFDAAGAPLDAPLTIGKKLHALGGMTAMLQFIRRLDEALEGMEFADGSACLRELEFCWNGIGDWQA